MFLNFCYYLKMPFSNRVNPKEYKGERHWGEVLADKVLEQFPDEEMYTCAAGISPSGTVHFGNFRDVITSYVVAQELIRRGKKARLLFSWDDFDRFRKVPAGIPESFAEHIGKPLSLIPDPENALPSYARRFETPFEESLREMDIETVYRYQNKEYADGAYDEHIISALKKRKEIAEILLSFMSEKGKSEKGIDPKKYVEEYYPISVYSRFSGTDNTRVLSYDGEHSITYKCFDTKKEETIDFTKERIVKLSWKIDWPMRWLFERVVFEPGGHDHASPGSSYDVSTVIVEKIFDRTPPVFAEYKFVGIQGTAGKMSGSKGNAVSPAQLLEIYEPELLKWLYMRKSPDQAFSLAFDTEIFRQYDEYDKERESLAEGKLGGAETRALEYATGKLEKKNMKPIPFRQAVAFGQIVQFDAEKLADLLAKSDLDYDRDSIAVRLKKAKAWLEIYNPEQMIVVRENPNREYAATLAPETRDYLKKLVEKLKNGISSVEELEKFIYALPKDESLEQKENALRQRAFFKDVYNLLISADTGPRLSTFISALGTPRVIPLLEA